MLDSFTHSGLAKSIPQFSGKAYSSIYHGLLSMVDQVMKHKYHGPKLQQQLLQWGQKAWLLQFSSWVALFFLSLLFMLHLLSQGPFPMLTIIISLSWDPSHSLYAPSNPYAVPYTTTGQGTLFAYLFLVMDDYSSSQFSRICCILLLLIFLSMAFHGLPFLLSETFYLVPSCSFAYSADLLLSI